MPATTAATTVKSLAELGALRKALQRRAREAAEQAARAQAANRDRDRDRDLDLDLDLDRDLDRDPTQALALQHDLFARTVGPVHRLPDSGLAVIDLPRPAPYPRMRELDEAAALAESLSDEVNLESLLLTDDGLSFRRPGIGPDVVTRLRRGQWALQGEIDLHGCNRDQARDALAGYLNECHRRGMRCLRVVHGKGHGSPGRQPVLKARVQRWLAQRIEVIAFAQASGPQGGAGALVVLLAAQ